MYSRSHFQKSNPIVRNSHYCGIIIKNRCSDEVDACQSTVDTSHLDVNVLPNQVCHRDIKAGMYIFVANPFCLDILAYQVSYGLVIDDKWLVIKPINDVAKMLSSQNNRISLCDIGISPGVSVNKFTRTFTTLNDAKRWCDHVKSHPSFEIKKACLALEAKQKH